MIRSCRVTVLDVISPLSFSPARSGMSRRAKDETVLHAQASKFALVERSLMTSRLNNFSQVQKARRGFVMKGMPAQFSFLLGRPSHPNHQVIQLNILK